MVRKILLILNFFAVFLQTTQANEDLYWENYQRASSRTLLDYLRTVASRKETDDNDILPGKKDEIAYFAATGGAKPALAEGQAGSTGAGQRAAPRVGADLEAPDTPDETALWDEVLIFAAIVHDLYGFNKDPFDLLAIRRSYGLNSEGPHTKTHLIGCQNIITATRIFMNAGREIEPDFARHVKKLYETEYVPVLLNDLSLARIPAERARELASSFSKALTNDLALRVKECYRRLVCLTPEQYERMCHFGPLACFTESFFQDYVTQICQPEDTVQAGTAAQALIPTHPEVKHNPLKVSLTNGLIAERNERGYTIMRVTAELPLGHKPLLPETEYEYRLTFQRGGLNFSKYQTEADFKAAFTTAFKDARIIEDTPAPVVQQFRVRRGR